MVVQSDMKKRDDLKRPFPPCDVCHLAVETMKEATIWIHPGRSLRSRKEFDAYIAAHTTGGMISGTDLGNAPDLEPWFWGMARVGPRR